MVRKHPPKTTRWNPDDWSSSKTWGALFALGELDSPFEETGQQPVSSLRFWEHGAGTKEHLAAARLLAAAIDRVLVSPLVGAVRRKGRVDALDALAAILSEPSRTVGELAAAVSKQYEFGDYQQPGGSPQAADDDDDSGGFMAAEASGGSRDH